MISFSARHVSKYFFVDSLTALKRQNQIKLVNKLKNNLTPTYLSVKDTTLGAHSCGTMYKIVIESPVFLQKSKLEQHKMVMSAISDDLQQIHALNLKTRIPSQPNLLSLNMGRTASKQYQQLDD